MNKIKFSHDYQKLPENWENTQAILIGFSFHSNIQNFFDRCPQLKNTDTSFRGELGQYPITFTEALILTFIHLNTGKIFTTIRRFTNEKADYYCRNMFKTFELIRANE